MTSRHRLSFAQHAVTWTAAILAGLFVYSTADHAVAQGCGGGGGGGGGGGMMTGGGGMGRGGMGGGGGGMMGMGGGMMGGGMPGMGMGGMGMNGGVTSAGSSGMASVMQSMQMARMGHGMQTQLNQNATALMFEQQQQRQQLAALRQQQDNFRAQARARKLPETAKAASSVFSSNSTFVTRDALLAARRQQAESETAKRRAEFLSQQRPADPRRQTG